VSLMLHITKCLLLSVFGITITDMYIQDYH